MAMFRKEATGLYTEFMSQQNTDLIQDRLAQRVFNDTGYKIDRQDPDTLRGIMEGVYQDNFLGYRSQWEEIGHMNKVVLDILTPQVKTGIDQYLHFIDLQSKSPVATNLPASTRSWRSFNF